MMKLQIGIDASINSTGICFTYIDDNNFQSSEYYLLTPLAKEKIIKRKSKKEPKKLCSDSAKLIHYAKLTSSKEDAYTFQDLSKIYSASSQADELIKLILEHVSSENFEEVSIRMEGTLMSSGFSSKQSRVNDLITYAVEFRKQLLFSDEIHSYVDYISLIAPKTLKKHATGNGNSKKEAMIDAHKKLFSESFDYNNGKIDDLIDAYWLSTIDPLENKVYIKNIYEMYSENIKKLYQNKSE